MEQRIRGKVLLSLYMNHAYTPPKQMITYSRIIAVSILHDHNHDETANESGAGDGN